MLDKPKAKDGSKSEIDVKKMHQLLLEKGYYDEEELNATVATEVTIATITVTILYHFFFRIVLEKGGRSYRLWKNSARILQSRRHRVRVTYYLFI